MHDSPPLSGRNVLARFALIGLVLIVMVLAFGYVSGWLTPHRLTAQRLVNQLQANAGVFAGYRRNHAKGVCVAGYFDSNGQAQVYSDALVFTPGRTPVVGRFAIPGGNPYAPDGSVPIRSLALRFTQANGQQWRTGMNSMPVFPVATPQAFYELLQAQQPDPSTGKPDSTKIGAFFAAHPETAAFREWVKTAKPSASYATESYWSLNAFVLVDANGEKHPVRWRVVPETSDTSTGGSDADYLEADLTRRLAQGPRHWHLIVTLANPGDPTDDATKTWPSDRREIDAGTLVLTGTETQESGECRDINYDPTVLPHGIEISGDPLLPARSAAYATSYLRRTSEEAHLPGTAVATSNPETKP
ncbi:catalase family peroxidase [Dyella choica]|uniref:Catalase-related peroxidase n=1 Tax=Dyella choica TaxID=1927959 RepID=A0A3S0Q698_9GAMM|nr:catalase family peroxidase [Dyella choica]RUL78335.1 catalase family peroxidase [Dyella choica]